MNKIYLDGSAIVLEIGANYVTLNRTELSYNLIGNDFEIRDSGTNRAFVLGDYTEFTDNLATVFNTIAEAKTYLNSLFLKQVGGADGQTFPALKVGTITNYTEFETDGTPKYNGNATYWRDVDFPIIIRNTGPNIPALSVINGNLTAPQWQINDFNMCESQEFVHEWKEGSRVYFHLHLTTNGLEAVDKFVRFEIEFGYVNVDEQWIFPSVIDSGDVMIPANTPNKTMLIVSVGNFEPTGIKIAGHCLARLKRIASTGTAPAANPWVAMLQLHIECDTNGSRQMTVK